MPRDEYNLLAARIRKTHKPTRKEERDYLEFMRRNEAARASVAADLAAADAAGIAGDNANSEDENISTSGGRFSK